MRIGDFEYADIRPCPLDVSSYLEAAYTCVDGTYYSAPINTVLPFVPTRVLWFVCHCLPTHFLHIHVVPHQNDFFVMTSDFAFTYYIIPGYYFALTQLTLTFGLDLFHR